ncbi:tyrosine-type recombinase/integrase [Marinomonas transparens]|uniref:Site-specific integrase n=1 Tax=Marinomonas transparens TaxID=2795388 RepID=A0A934JQ76_9GAMM|nr:site-specific integrase [Marinomonas transparens]MBJ7539926.1 site-specific integrase [Marinomonas transparens]
MSHKVLAPCNCPKVVFSSGRTVIPVTEWLIERKFNIGLAYKTVRADADHLAHWLEFCESEKMDYLIDPTTFSMQRYRDESLVGLSNESCNLYLSSVCKFYWWCQNNTSYCSDMIGWPNKAYNIDFNIIVRKPSKGGSDFVIPFLKKSVKKPMRYIPKAHEIRALNDHLAKEVTNQKGPAGEFLAIRNQLMVRWATEAALRSEEIICLQISDLPLIDNVNFSMAEVYIHRGTKYGRHRKVKVSISLIKATWDYIEYERHEVIDQIWKKYGDVENVFINAGNKSLRPKMNRNTFYTLLTPFNSKITPHALRRFGLTRFAARLIKIERIIRKKNDLKQIDIRHVEQALKLQAGHQSVTTTIKRYVDYALAVELSEEEIEAVDTRIEELEWELENLKSRKGVSRNLREFI